MFDRLGSVLETLCHAGRDEAVLVAPFIKRAVLTRLLSALPVPVRLLCVTRWRPDEVAAGVSDPDIWLDIKEREGAVLQLCSSLHAKYYRVDETCFIGSANLTATALGWTVSPNFEILCTFTGSVAERDAFERQLSALSVPCNDALYHHVKATADLMKMEAYLPMGEAASELVATAQCHDEAIPNASIAVVDRSIWLPLSPEPADLYSAYSGRAERLTDDVRVTTMADLAMLQIPSGLTEPAFMRYVGMQLFQVPSIAAVNAFISQPQRFGVVKAYLISLPCSKAPRFDATRAWQTLMRWLLYFLPERYEHSVPNHSEVFRIRQ